MTITLLTGLISCLVPALENAHTNGLEGIRLCCVTASQGKAPGTGAREQIVLATILLSSTVILIQGFRASWSPPMGFDSSGILTFELLLPERQYSDANHRRIFFDSVAQAVAMPGQRLKPAVARVGSLI